MRGDRLPSPRTQCLTNPAVLEFTLITVSAKLMSKNPAQMVCCRYLICQVNRCTLSVRLVTDRLLYERCFYEIPRSTSTLNMRLRLLSSVSLFTESTFQCQETLSE